MIPRPMTGEEINTLLASQLTQVQLLSRIVELLEAKAQAPAPVVNNTLGSKPVPTYPPGKRHK